MRTPPSLIALAAVSVVILLSGCGGDETTFSTAAYDGIEQGESAEAVRSALGEPTETESFDESAELWVYCDGPTPYYLAITDGRVSIAGLRPPDELRVDEQACG